MTVSVAFGCTSEERSFGGHKDAPDASAGDTTATFTSADASQQTSTDATGITRDVDSISIEIDPSETTEAVSDAATAESDSGGDTLQTTATSGETIGWAGSDPTAATTGERSASAASMNDGSSTGPLATSETTDTEGDTNDAFGVGQPPSYGNLGTGDGNILVVNALADGSSVDVWLAGAASPVVERLAMETASRVTVSRGAQRVVLTRTGTSEVVGCSEWFPLGTGEQWAVVPTGGDHTCSGSGDGSTLSFRQDQALDENPVRYVHATAPDSFSLVRDQQTEPGTLEAGETLTGTRLPNCASGCEVRYQLRASGVTRQRHFSLAVSTLNELPPAGEVMLLVLGDVRQDWPGAPDASRLLRVDLDGSTYVIRRNPEIAFGRVGSGIATFSVLTPPSTSEVATADPDCEECVLEARTWRAGTRTFFVDTPEGSADIQVEMEDGHRYVLLSTAESTNPLFWLDADFDRDQADAAYVRALNLDESGGPLSFGRVFGDSAVAIETLASVPWGEVSSGYGGAVPADDGWRLVTAYDPDSLGAGCFYSVETPPGYRGYFIAAEWMQQLNLDVWPPTLGMNFLICF